LSAIATHRRNDDGQLDSETVRVEVGLNGRSEHVRGHPSGITAVVVVKNDRDGHDGARPPLRRLAAMSGARIGRSRIRDRLRIDDVEVPAVAGQVEAAGGDVNRVE